MTSKHMKIKILAVGCICIASSAYAGGYRVALQGQNATGMGHTGVAATDNPEAVFFNPAAMPFLEDTMNLTTGVTLIDGVTKYQNVETNSSAQTDSGIGTPAYLYLTRKFNKDIAYGFGFYTPFGNSVEWERDWAGSHLVNNISLQTMFFQPTVSYKYGDLVSLGIGVSFVTGSVELNRNLSTSLVDENGDRTNVTLDASNVNSWAYNVGVLVKPHKSLAMGLSYRSKVDLKARGASADFENLPGSMKTAYADTTFDADLVLPAEATAGVSFTFNKNTTIAVDINRTFWNAYESLDVTFDNAAGVSSNPRNYSDSNVYRFGVQQKLFNKLTLRAGAYYDETPISDGYFTPETARNDTIGITAGASYAATKNLGISVSMLYLMFDEFSGSYDYYEQSDNLVSFGGDYISSVRTFGFSLNYQY